LHHIYRVQVYFFFKCANLFSNIRRLPFKTGASIALTTTSDEIPYFQYFRIGGFEVDKIDSNTNLVNGVNITTNILFISRSVFKQTADDIYLSRTKPLRVNISVDYNSNFQIYSSMGVRILCVILSIVSVCCVVDGCLITVKVHRTLDPSKSIFTYYIACLVSAMIGSSIRAVVFLDPGGVRSKYSS
jgi:hypothetical protein